MPEKTTDWRAYVEAYARENPQAVRGVNDGALAGSVGVKLPGGRPVPPPPPTDCSEAEFQTWVRAVFLAGAWDFYHTRKSKGSDPGFPDSIACRSGSLVVAELKVKKNKPTKAQSRWLEAFRLCGARTFLWYPRDWEQILEVAK